MAISEIIAPEKSEKNNIVLPEDTYQAVISKIQNKDGKKYLTNEPEKHFLFTLSPLQLEDEQKGKKLFLETTHSFFNGESNGSEQVSPSKLYLIMRAVYRFYKPDVKINELKQDDITVDMINFMEGKQIRIVVALNNKGKNKIASLLSIKEEIQAPIEIPTATAHDAEVQAEVDGILGGDAV